MVTLAKGPHPSEDFLEIVLFLNCSATQNRNIRVTITYRPFTKRMAQFSAGWFALVMYAFASSPIGTGILTVFGTLDTDHQAMLQMSATGPCLVLHHQQICAGHEHHAVARALTLFARPFTDKDPDHVLQFCGVDGFWRDTHQIVSINDSEAQAELILTESNPKSANLQPYLFPRPGPPPDSIFGFL